jgi:methyl-accepting chemotaxis protein
MATLTRPGASRRAGVASLHAQLTTQDGPLRAVLESLNANVFVADPDLNLIWMNRKAAVTLKALAPEMRSAFGLDIGSVLGGSIHRFHRDPARIERILKDPASMPREATFSFGGVTLRTLINAVTDESGDRLGFVVAWDNVTERNARADQAVRQVVGATHEIVERVAVGVENAQRNAAHAQTAAAATEQLRAAVSEISRSTVSSADQVRRAVAATAEGVEKLRDLEGAGREIGEFLRLITGLAEQTKMLALNANIEAARAGEAGRGFAVVADEVKNLAGTTAASITDIESRILAIQGSTMAGFEALEEIKRLVDSIDESHSTVAAAIEEQSVVTAEIARAISDIAEGAHSNRETLDAAAAAVQGVADQAGLLHQMILSS